jgi:hypothetical protein
MGEALTPDERRAIEWDCTRLINRYANLGDAGRWEEVAALYTDDGVMARPSKPDAPIAGRAAILESFLARPHRAQQHFFSNIVVTAESADRASAYSGIMLFTGKDAALITGFYRDTLVRTPAGWRFAERIGGLTFP